MTVSAEAIAAALDGFRFVWRDEYELQDGIASVLSAAGWPVRREVPLAPRCRIDLLVDRVGVEVKVAGSPEVVARQLQRYARQGALTGLVLATTCPAHRALPERVGGLPLTLAYLTHLA
jgi:alkanesulfonate monooxygenase SsuD/methylene tetrahydromethanopterin reductase-like flavin-dependent oxidoreductase (luciferase family)